MNVKKKHLDLTAKRIKVKIPPHTKTRTGRTTFLTKEASEKIQKRLEKLGPEDYVFCKQSPLSGGENFRHALRRILDRLELNERYESNNFYKITTHNQGAKVTKITGVALGWHLLVTDWSGHIDVLGTRSN